MLSQLCLQFTAGLQAGVSLPLGIEGTLSEGARPLDLSGIQGPGSVGWPSPAS